MQIEFDPEKDAKNQRTRGLSFAAVADLEWSTALVEPDERADYGEPRRRVYAMLDGRLHIAVITPRGDAIRVISLRRANDREVKRYGRRTPT